MLKREHATADERLPKLVAEVARSVRRLYQNLLRCLVKPLAHRQYRLPRAVAAVGQPGVGRHVDSRACYGPRAHATAHAVANLASRARGGAVERLDGCREIVGLGLQRDDALDVFHSKIVARRLVAGCKLLHHGPAGKGNVVFISRENLVWVFLGCLLDKGKEARLHLLAVYDKRAAEYLVAAVLRVDLGEAEYLGVGKRAPQLAFNLVQILNFFLRKGQALLLVVLFKVFDVLYRLRLVVDGEYGLVEPVVHPLQHRVVVGILARHGEILFDAGYAMEVHVLRYLHGIGTPRSDHLAARSDEEAFKT